MRTHRLHAMPIHLPPTPTPDERLRRQGALKLVECIETECDAVDLSGYRWYDTRPMLNANELPAELIDMNTEILDLALTAGLIARHPAPQLTHLVHLLVCPL